MGKPELSPNEPGPYIARAKAHRDARRFSLAREELFSARVKGGDRDEIDRLLRELDRIPSALPWEASLAYAFEREGLSFSHAFFMRRYFETVDDFAEFGAGAGREVVANSTGRGTEIRRPYLLSFRAQKFFLTWLGVSISANYSNDNLARHRVVSIGIIMRW